METPASDLLPSADLLRSEITDGRYVEFALPHSLRWPRLDLIHIQIARAQEPLRPDASQGTLVYHTPLEPVKPFCRNFRGCAHLHSHPGTSARHKPQVTPHPWQIPASRAVCASVGAFN